MAFVGNVFELYIIMYSVSKSYVFNDTKSEYCICNIGVRQGEHLSPLLFAIFLNGRKEGNVLFNDALNTFYLRLYGVRHMVNDHSDSERGNQLPPHELFFPISSKGSFICSIQQTGLHIPRPLLHQLWITAWNEK